MTDEHAKDTPVKPKAGGQNLWIDLGPVAVFVIVYNYLRGSDPDGAIYTAAAVFMGVAIIALAYSRIKHGKTSNMLLLSTAIIVISVGLAFLFNNPVFIYMKPTVINALFGIGVLGGVFFKKNVIKMMMGGAFEMPDKAWNTLAIRWGIFFFALAIINEIVWRGFSEAFWANFKLFGMFPLTLLFTISQVPFMMKNGKMRDE